MESKFPKRTIWFRRITKIKEKQKKMGEKSQNTNYKNELYPENCEEKEKESFKEPKVLDTTSPHTIITQIFYFSIQAFLCVPISQNTSTALLAFIVSSSNVKNIVLDLFIFTFV